MLAHHKALLSFTLRAAMLAGLAVLFVYRAAYNLGRIDYPNSNFGAFWLAGHMVVSGQDPYDSDEWTAAHDAYDIKWRPNATFLYPLPLAFMLAPLGLLPLPMAYLGWQVLSEIAIAAVIWRLLVHSAESGVRRLFVPLAALAVFFGPIYLTLQIGALGAFTLFAIAAAILAWDAKIPFVAGLLLSLTMLKPSQGTTILLLAAVWLISRRDWRALGGLGAGIGMMIALGMLADPLWMVKFAASSRILLEETVGRQSNAMGVAGSLCGGQPRCTWLVGGIGSTLILALGIVLLWRLRRLLAPWEAFNIIIPLACAAAIYVWSYDQILLLIPLVWIVGALWRRTRSYLAPLSYAVVLVLISLVLLWRQAIAQNDVLSILTTAIVFGSLAALGYRSRRGLTTPDPSAEGVSAKP